jgi:hypothetical protein
MTFDCHCQAIGQQAAQFVIKATSQSYVFA